MLGPAPDGCLLITDFARVPTSMYQPVPMCTNRVPTCVPTCRVPMCTPNWYVMPVPTCTNLYQRVPTCTNVYQPAGCRPLLTDEQRQIWLWMMPCYRLCLSMICPVRHKNNAWPDHDRETSRHLLPTKRGRPTQQNETALKNVCPHNIFRSTCISDNKIYPQSYILLDHIISYLAFEVKSSLGGSCKQTENRPSSRIWGSTLLSSQYVALCQVLNPL